MIHRNISIQRYLDCLHDIEIQIFISRLLCNYSLCLGSSYITQWLVGHPGHTHLWLFRLWRVQRKNVTNALMEPTRGLCFVTFNHSYYCVPFIWRNEMFTLKVTQQLLTRTLHYAISVRELSRMFNQISDINSVFVLLLKSHLNTGLLL